MQDNIDPEQEELIIQECFEMLENFHIWDGKAAEYWQNNFKARAVPTALGEVISGRTYYDAETACTIILIRSARLILLLTMLLYYKMIQHVDSGEHRSLDNTVPWAEYIPVLEQDVHKTIDDIISSVPYALGDVDPSGVPASMPYDGAAAIIIAHSIRLVSNCAYATSDQLEKAKSILIRIKSAIGIRSAVR